MAKGNYHVSFKGDKYYVYDNNGCCCSDGIWNWNDAQALRWELEGWGVPPQRRETSRSGDHLETNISKGN